MARQSMIVAVRAAYSDKDRFHGIRTSASKYEMPIDGHSSVMADTLGSV